MRLTVQGLLNDMGVAADKSIDFAHLDKYVCGDAALLDEIHSIFV